MLGQGYAICVERVPIRSPQSVTTTPPRSQPSVTTSPHLDHSPQSPQPHLDHSPQSPGQGEENTHSNKDLTQAKTAPQTTVPDRPNTNDALQPNYSPVVKGHHHQPPSVAAAGSVVDPAVLLTKELKKELVGTRQDEVNLHHREDLHDGDLDNSFYDELPYTESLHSGADGDVVMEEGVSREVASLVESVRRQGMGRCALAVTTDHHHLPALHLLLTQHLDNSTTFPSSLAEKYKSVGRETCVHYVFLVSDPSRLLHLLAGLYQDALYLWAKFVLVTHLHVHHILDFLQTSPVNKIVQVLLVTPSASQDGVALHLYTHLFFLEQRRLTLKKLGTWPLRNSSSTSSTSSSAGKVRGALQFFPEKLSNFNGFRFRVTTFNHPPVSIFESLPDGDITYDGLEIRLLSALASALNFTVEINLPRDGEKWGSRLPNGSWTGAVGETIRGETDVSFANYFITADRLKVMDMTESYYIDYACFITPKPQPLPQYTAVAWPFHVSVWGAVLVTLMMVPPAVRVAGLVEPGSWFRRLDNAFWYVLGVFLTRSQPFQLVPSSSGLRVVVITSWVAAMVISVAYKSSLIAFLMVPLPAQPINTLAQLLESGLRWGVRDRGGWDEWFSNSLDPTSQKIAAGFEFVNGIERGLARVLEGNFAFMNSGTFLRYLVASNFTDEFGQTELHIAKQCFVPFRQVEVAARL
ncbi:ionotropic receptor 21a-like [Homarus americanus]|uniref:ionotropic receptor 21a-like n=1 Tax=Homarus americanus TaxID=6706 RepID=UPI001C48F4DE|nr:ionotropic receptor 21a-like [Homarus americanus]